MPRYLTLTDNEDGTITLTTNVLGDQTTMVLPIPLDALIENFGVPTTTIGDLMDTFEENMIIVPNEV